MNRRLLSRGSRMRNRIDIVRPMKTKKAGGGFTSSLETVMANVPAEVIALTGSEAVRERVLRGVRVYRVTMRWREGVLQSDQLRLGADFGGDVVNIRSIAPDRRRGEIVIQADTESVETR